MKDHPLRAWLSVVDRGSIRAAARALGLTQPAVTKAVRKLWADLCTPLLHRSVRGVELTEFGQLLTVRAYPRATHRQPGSPQRGFFPHGAARPARGVAGGDVPWRRSRRPGPRRR
jgi:hypothetical protein